MKSRMSVSLILLALLYIPAAGQDIEALLPGSNATRGFSILNSNPSTLFTVRGDGAVGVQTATPTASLHVAGTNGFLVTGTNGSGAIPAEGVGTRMMFYPKKAAFRAGSVNGSTWDDTSIGEYSVAFGRSTTASGDRSTAMGGSTDATGSYSTAMGSFTEASGSASTAMGASTIASGNNATAMGLYTTASGSNATAMGNGTLASGVSSTAMGARVAATGDGSFAIGDNSSSSPNVSISTANRFAARFANGYHLFTTSSGESGVGSKLNAGANSWSTISDSTKKTNFLAADGERMLMRFRGLRLGSWNYKSQDAALYRHYGAMAQEWFAAFGHDGIGRIGDETTLSSADVDGVLSIAVQALERRTAELREKVAEITALREQLTKVQNENEKEMSDLRRKLDDVSANKEAEMTELRKQLDDMQQEMQALRGEFAAQRAQSPSPAPRLVHGGDRERSE